jgi:undecaprenyl-diphosphatase
MRSVSAAAMSFELFWQTVLLGVIEGLTEFLPVSSTGHLILAIDLLGFEGPAGKGFEIVIQLGAILAVCVVYFGRLMDDIARLPRQRGARSFALSIVLAFLPAALVGPIAYRFIKSVLFSPYVVSVSLIVGGVVLILVDRVLPRPIHHKGEDIPPLKGLFVGCFQVISMIPGVSRAGATIIGALLLRADRRAATEFSFFLAIPTMLGAAAYDLYKNWGALNALGEAVIAIGFVAAFVSALFVVRTMIGFVSRHGFAPFGWYRIAIGLAMLAILAAR